ncbi:cysteine-rich small domain-containing protein [uncultured Cloacibacillus sp.]|uniref:cysteine-rich small domain-containing protein n=1 Tax=uncultured Cloacibacillus sp. TaxID=889794 RepID=UPI0026DAF59E|nr:cysteine-rich small domain-containing protein [uncultured Cloacibacillus sp.]
MSKKYEYFSHSECEFYPCHAGADEDNFNCLFCYCPLYVLGDRCGGNFRYLENGYKDCSGCLYPHNRGNYDAIMKRYGEILAAITPHGDEHKRPPQQTQNAKPNRTVQEDNIKTKSGGTRR